MYRVDQASEIVNIPIFKRFYYMYPPRPRHHSSYKNTYRKSLNKRVPPSPLSLVYGRVLSQQWIYGVGRVELQTSEYRQALHLDHRNGW